jgi:hypothetical protein
MGIAYFDIAMGERTSDDTRMSSIEWCNELKNK